MSLYSNTDSWRKGSMVLRAAVGLIVMLVLGEIAYAETTNNQGNTVKLKPIVRQTNVEKPALTISMETLKPFIRNGIILDDKKQFLSAPYVLAEYENRIVGEPRSVIYVRGLKSSEETTYGIYREGKSYKHPVTGEKLGFEAISVGTAELKTLGDPAEFIVATATESVEVGTRLLPNFASSLVSNMTIRPAQPMTDEGYILSVRGAINEAGRNQVVLISLGQRDGLVEGNTLDVMQTGQKVVDKNAKGWRKKLVQLPDVRIGSVLVYQTYEKMSLGLVLESTEIINLLDKVKSP